MGSRSRYVWIGSPDFDRDRIRIGTVHAIMQSAHAMCVCVAWSVRDPWDCGRRSFFRHSEATSTEFWLAALILVFAFCHGSSFKRLVLAAVALLRMVPMTIGL